MLHGLFCKGSGLLPSCCINTGVRVRRVAIESCGGINSGVIVNRVAVESCHSVYTEGGVMSEQLPLRR